MATTLRYTLADIHQAVVRFWDIVKDAHIIAFNGEMGAGKTTFIHELCTYLGVEDAVSSPTFALINEYRLPAGHKHDIIYHMDWYRIKNEEEAMNAGMEDCMLNQDAYCFIEWPEKAAALLHGTYMNVTVESVSPDERVMTITAVK